MNNKTLAAALSDLKISPTPYSLVSNKDKFGDVLSVAVMSKPLLHDTAWSPSKVAAFVLVGNCTDDSFFFKLCAENKDTIVAALLTAPTPQKP